MNVAVLLDGRWSLAIWTQRLALVLLGWGALAFGAVYPWSYWPLAAASALCGCLGLLVANEGRRPRVSYGLLSSLGACAAAVLVQLIPVPISSLAALSPGTTEFLADWNVAFAAGLLTRHPVSINPEATWVGLGLFAAFSTFFLGLTCAMSYTGCRWFVERLTVFGVVLALLGLVQGPLWGRAVYGFWMPVTGANPFGPFINKNHFAGWMLMALPLTLSLVCAEMVGGIRGVREHWRDRLMWFDSHEANKLLRLAAAVVLMALSLVMTMSRSGMGGLALGLGITGFMVTRQSHSMRRRTASLVYLLSLVLVVVSWVGVDVLATRFAGTDWSGLNGRIGAWSDAVRVARAFPLAGSGFNTYGDTMLRYQRHDLEWHYQEAHNDYLQLAAEGGLLLCLPFLVVLSCFVRDVRGRIAEGRDGFHGRWIRLGAVTSLLAIACQEIVEFSLQMPGNAVLFAVVAAIALHRPRRRESSHAPRYKAE